MAVDLTKILLNAKKSDAARAASEAADTQKVRKASGGKLNVGSDERAKMAVDLTKILLNAKKSDAARAASEAADTQKVRKASGGKLNVGGGGRDGKIDRKKDKFSPRKVAARNGGKGQR
jgi:PHP family Zn ribbon phosphoesterase